MRKSIFWMLVLLSACQASDELTIDIQGHRGARGLMPENTIPGFLEAVRLGVNTLELDLSVTRDSQLVVSHEPFFSEEICFYESGESNNIYEMTYDQVAAVDCGSKEHRRFPTQKKMKVSKPLLTEVFKKVEAYLDEEQLPKVRYNIELKTRLETDSIYHPHPFAFSDLVYNEITAFDLWDRVNIQSFDFRTLQYFHEQYREVELALLIENSLTYEENLDSLGFIPEIYSPNYELLSRDLIKELQEKGMKVIPWTANEIEAIQRLVEWGVDGIITDYPDRAIKLIK